MSYYVLWAGDRYPGENTRDLEGGAWGGIMVGTFKRGEKLLNPPVVPIEINTFEEDSGEMPPLFVVPALVVRKDFRKVLLEAGVDNIDYYPAIIHDRRRGTTWNDYFVGNVLGMIDAVDMKKSVASPTSPPGNATLFETMVMDEAKCHGKKLFRLATKPSMILVSEDVRRHIEERHLRYVHLIPPEEFA